MGKPSSKNQASSKDSSASSSGAGIGWNGKLLSRVGSAALGPFSVDEFSQLQQLFLSLAGEGGKYIDPAKFERHFALDGADWFPKRLLDVFLAVEQQAVSGSRGDRVTLEGFRQAVASTCRNSRGGMIQTLFDICDDATGPSSMNKSQLGRLFEAAHLCSTAAWASDTGSTRFRSEKLAESVLNHLKPQRAGGVATAATAGAAGAAGAAVAEGVSSSELKAWVAERAPLLHHCLSTFMNTRCFLYGDAKEEGIAGLPSKANCLPSSLAVFSPPRPQQSSFLLEEFKAELFGLALSSKALQGPWLRIYTSEEDGMSFNRIAYKLVGFGGPSIIVVRERESGAVWGGCADSPWKESNSFYGGEGSFLVRLSPDFQVMPSKIASNGNFQYLNMKGFSLPHGIGMGGSTNAFRFFLPEALDGTCQGRSACLTFEDGELCPSTSRRFEVDSLEVWGVGGEEALGEALEARNKQRDYTAQQIQKARQVDKSKFATNAFDKEFLLGKTFGGSGGRYNANEDRRQGEN